MYSIPRRAECAGYLENMFKFHYPGIGAIVMYMAIEAVAVMALIILIEVGVAPISHSLAQG